MTIVTGSTVQGSTVDFTALANADLTLVVLMGVERRAVIADELLGGGLAAATPVAVVEWASTSGSERCVAPSRNSARSRCGHPPCSSSVPSPHSSWPNHEVRLFIRRELLMFPLIVDLTNRRVVVIGAGRVGVHKAAQLLDSGALVTMISSEVLAPVPAGVAELRVRPYEQGDLAEALLVVAATGDAAVNDLIVKEANERNILVNVVDDLGRSDFYFTAVHRDGDVVVSVSTGGASPALAQWVRDAVARALPEEPGERGASTSRRALGDPRVGREYREPRVDAQSQPADGRI